MPKICKCTHDKTDHSRKKFYLTKTCSVCYCSKYMNQNNNFHIIQFIVCLASMIITSFFILDRLVDMTDNLFFVAHHISTFPPAYLDNALFQLIIGGVLLGTTIMIFGNMCEDAISNYLTPNKQSGLRSQ